MIRIIDRTLTALDYGKRNVSPDQMRDMVTLLSKAGADYIELPVEALKIMKSLPPDIKYILRVGHAADAALFPDFDRFIAKSKEQTDSGRLISEIQINDVREIELLGRYSYLSQICITGLADLILGGYQGEMKKILAIFGKNTFFCPENDLSCATAMAIEWLLGGGRNVVCSFAGIGGYAAIEEVIVAVRIAMRLKMSVDLSVLPRLKSLYESLTGLEIPENKAILGRKIFMVESGVHADGIRKNPSIYEPYPPDSVGKERSIVLGKHSGRGAVRIKGSELGFELKEHHTAQLLEMVKSKSIALKRSLTDQEFFVMLREVTANES